MAVWLTEGKSIRGLAEATGQAEGAICWRLKRIQEGPLERAATR